jgi:hypothetical protein
LGLSFDWQFTGAEAWVIELARTARRKAALQPISTLGLFGRESFLSAFLPPFSGRFSI